MNIPLTYKSPKDTHNEFSVIPRLMRWYIWNISVWLHKIYIYHFKKSYG